MQLISINGAQMWCHFVTMTELQHGVGQLAFSTSGVKAIKIFLQEHF